MLLGDRPALTPVESFYQRMLAGDPDEALEQAELLLRDRSLSSYYDEVALKGLQLAANDSVRGVLTPTQLERIKARSSPWSAISTTTTTPTRIRPATRTRPTAPPRAESRSRSSRRPPGRRRRAAAPAWRSDTPVLCIAGRGPLDAAASEMLAQLLAKHGLGARVVDHQAVAAPRSAIWTSRASRWCASPTSN